VKTVLFQTKLTQAEAQILQTLGGGVRAEGFRVAMTWVSHFYNMGLRDDQNLDFIGLAVKLNPEITLNWQDYQAHENASKTDLNALQDDFEGLGDMGTPQ
jgi:hypothetical protein